MGEESGRRHRRLAHLPDQERDDVNRHLEGVHLPVMTTLLAFAAVAFVFILGMLPVRYAEFKQFWRHP